VIATEFEELTGRASGGLVRAYRTEDAEIIIVALGSVLARSKTPSIFDANWANASAWWASPLFGRSPVTRYAKL